MPEHIHVRHHPGEALDTCLPSPGKPPLNNLHELEIRSALLQNAGRAELTQTAAEKTDSLPSLAKRRSIPIFLTWKRQPLRNV